MRKYIVLSFFSFLISCKEETFIPDNPPEINVHVVDSNGDPIEADVKIYMNQEDWENELNPIASQETKDGVAKFEEIEGNELWVKATYLDYSSYVIYQNTLTAFKPIERLPEGSKASIKVMVNASKSFKLIVKKVIFEDYSYNQSSDIDNIFSHIYCSVYHHIMDDSGPESDLYLETRKLNNNSIYETFYQSNILIDYVSDGRDLIFDTDLQLDDLLANNIFLLKDHFIVNPEKYTEKCDYIEETLSEELKKPSVVKEMRLFADKEIAYFNFSDQKNLPKYPYQVITHSLQNDFQIKLELEWVFVN